MKIKLLFVTLLISATLFAQEETLDSIKVENRLDYNNTDKLTFGGYAQIDYNEPSGSKPGKLDVHRLVMLFGYRFNEKVSFMTEIELEHVKEVYVEQAFVNYNVNPAFNIKGGLMLVPMGIINEYHEPPVYYGVERPGIDHDIVPTTWRELGVGVSGKMDALSLKYQAYLFNGFVSYKDGSGTLRGKDGFRKGRQKGAESIVNAPNFSTKIDYYGILGLKLGLAGYFGKTQTDDSSLDASTVDISMIGFDARYAYNNFELKGQYIFSDIGGSEDYNSLTGSDLGSGMSGFYGELAYNFMPLMNRNTDKKFVLFGRYENYNTHHKTEGFEPNMAYDRTDLTVGFDYKPVPGVALKVDYQWLEDGISENNRNNQFNAGIGVMF